MKTGYQIIEPAPLAKLLAAPKSFEVTIAMLSWLVDVLRRELQAQLGAATIEIIRAEYHGPYPAIGIRYDTDDRDDLGPLVEEAITTLIQQGSISTFIDYLGQTDVDWSKATRDLLGPRQ